MLQHPKKTLFLLSAFCSLLCLNAWAATPSLTGYSGNLAGITFVWSFTPRAYSSTATTNAHAVLSGAPAAVNFPTPSNVAALVTAGLQPGMYQVSVIAQDGQGHQSNPGVGVTTLVVADFSQVKIYPNPWKSDKHAGKSVTFANLPIGSTVKLFTVSGHKVKALTETAGQATWDLTNDSGDKVGSGIYMYLITVGDTGYGGNAQKVRGKLVVIK